MSTPVETQAPTATAAVPPATPSTAPAPAPAAAPEATPSNEAPAEAPKAVDFNRFLDDEDYAASVEKDMAAPAPEEPKEAAAQPTAAPPAAVVEEDPVIETIVVEGREYPVHKSEAKALMQKGRYMEKRFERISPLLALEREAPELIEAWRDSEQRRQALEKIRSKGPAVQPTKESEDTEEGIDEADLQLIDRRAEKRARQLLEQAGIRIPSDGDREREKQEQEWAQRTIQSTIQALEIMDPDFEGTKAAANELLQEMERTQPPEKYQAFRAAVDNPRNVHPTTGRPLFVHFLQDAVAWKRQKSTASTAPAAATPAPAKPVRPTITATLEPGATRTTVPGRPGAGPNIEQMTPKERRSYFERLIDGD